MLKKLSTLTFNVNAPETLSAFYRDILGMQPMHSGLGFGDAGAELCFQSCARASAYQPGPTDRYWKIAITLPDLNLAVAWLRQHNVVVSDPHQFRDIARMSHLRDPEGHVIELIQHQFEDTQPRKQGNPDLPLGGGAEIGLITLRTTDIDAELAHYLALGMKYLSRQALTDIGFDLYFLACTDEVRPDPDVNAVANREWLWQRPYTVLEFQHLLNAPGVQMPDADAPGYVGMVFSCADGSLHREC
ncbi:VOC family protein [Thalassobius sp. I31.1]|uniref:VOC family protein n=1 Tax=Thalassobius sp. I31.1 TaxID=2109912 RepID=UPI000D1AC13D|nr:VOC family protein [Thalassobius sp. I31.1]